MTRLLLAVAAFALVAAGCGAAENDPNLAEAAEKTEATGSGRFEVRGRYDESGGLASLACTGSADYENKRVTVSCTYEGIGVFEAIAIGDDFYLRGDAVSGLGSRDKWVKESGDVDEDTSLGNLSPQRFLAMLRGASSETARVGEEDVRGIATTRYRLTVDCEAADLDCEETSAVDVWIADDGIVRRIAIDDDSSDVTFEFFDFGADVDIQPPTPEQVVDPAHGSASGGSCSPDRVAYATLVTVETTQRVLRRHGFSVRRSEPFCTPFYDAAMLTNLAEGPQQDVIEREGYLGCSVMNMKPGSGGKMLVEGVQPDASVKLDYRNVQCTLFAEGADEPEKVARLRAAFAELERTTP